MPAPLVADVDGDGLDDLVYTRDFVVRIRRNTGSGFGPEVTTAIDTTVNGGASLMPVLAGAAALMAVTKRQFPAVFWTTSLLSFCREVRGTYPVASARGRKADIPAGKRRRGYAAPRR